MSPVEVIRSANGYFVRQVDPSRYTTPRHKVIEDGDAATLPQRLGQAVLDVSRMTQDVEEKIELESSVSEGGIRA